MNSVMSNIFKYISKYRLYVVLSIACAAVYALLSLYIPILTGDAVDVIVTKGDVDFDKIFEILLKDLLVILLAALAQWIMGVCNNKISYNVIRDLRKDAFEKIQILPLSYIDSHAHGDIVSRIISDVDTFSDGLLLGFSQLFTGVVTILATVFFMLSISWKVGLLVIALTPLSLIAASVVAKLIYKMFRRQSEIKGRQTSYINEMIGNVRTVKAYGRESDVTKDFKEINDELTDVSTKAIFYSAITNPLTRFINSLVYASVALYGAFNVIALNMTVGNLTSILMYANQYTKPFNEISSVITEMQNAFACAERVFELINRKERVPEKEDAVELTNVSGNVEFKNVSFNYPSININDPNGKNNNFKTSKINDKVNNNNSINKNKNYINNISFKLENDEAIVISGKKNSGKSTIVNLLERLYEPNLGNIFYKEYDLKSLDLKWIRNKIGYVSHEPSIINGSFKDNILYGISKNEIINNRYIDFICQFLKIDNYIPLINGYDTIISELNQECKLTKGQQKLISLGRVLIKRPKILVLDEILEDLNNEIEIQRNIKSCIERLIEEKNIIFPNINGIIIITGDYTNNNYKIKGVDKVYQIANNKISKICV